jgi:hypothetical protein
MTTLSQDQCNEKANCVWSKNNGACTFSQMYFDREWTEMPTTSSAAPRPVGCKPVKTCTQGEFVIHPATQVSDNVCGVIEDNVCVPNYAGMSVAGGKVLTEGDKQVTCASLITKATCQAHATCRWAESDAILASVITGANAPTPCNVDWVQKQCMTQKPTTMCALEGQTTGTFDAGYWCGGSASASASGCTTKRPNVVCRQLGASCAWSPAGGCATAKPLVPVPGNENPPVFLWGESRLTSCPPAQVMVRAALTCGNLTQDECGLAEYKHRCTVPPGSTTGACQSKYNTAHCEVSGLVDGEKNSDVSCPKGPGGIGGNYYIKNAECADLHDYCIARLEERNYSLVNRPRKQEYPLAQHPLLSNCLHNDTPESLGISQSTVWFAPFVQAGAGGAVSFLDTAQFLADNLLPLDATDKPLLLTKYSNLDLTPAYTMKPGMMYGNGPACGVGNDIVPDPDPDPDPDGAACMHTVPKDRCMYRFPNQEQAVAACLYYNGHTEDIRSNMTKLPQLALPLPCKGVVKFVENKTLGPTISTSLPHAVTRSTYCMNYNTFTALPGQTFQPIAAGFAATKTGANAGTHGYSTLNSTVGQLTSVPTFTAPDVHSVHPFGNNMMPMGQTWVGKHALGHMAQDDQQRIHFVTRGGCKGTDTMPQFGAANYSFCAQPSPYRGTPNSWVNSAIENATSASECYDLADEINDLVPPGAIQTSTTTANGRINHAPTWGGDDGDDNGRARAWHGKAEYPVDAAFNDDDSTALSSCRANHNAWGDPSKISPTVWSALGEVKACRGTGGTKPKNQYTARGKVDQTCMVPEWHTAGKPNDGGPFSMDMFAQTTGFDIAFFNVFKGQTADNAYQFDRWTTKSPTWDATLCTALHTKDACTDTAYCSWSDGACQPKAWSNWGWGGGGAGTRDDAVASWAAAGVDPQAGVAGAMPDGHQWINNMTWIANASKAPALARPEGNLTLGMYGQQCNNFLHGLGMGGPTYNLAPAKGHLSFPAGEWGLPPVPPDMLAPYAWWSGTDDGLREKMWMHLPVHNGIVGHSQRQMGANGLIDGKATGSLGYVNSNTNYQSNVLLELPELLLLDEAPSLQCATVHKLNLFGGTDDNVVTFSNDMGTTSLGSNDDDNGQDADDPKHYAYLKDITDQVSVQWLAGNGLHQSYGAMSLGDLNMWAAGVGTTHSSGIKRIDPHTFTFPVPDTDFTPLPNVTHWPLDYAVMPVTSAAAGTPLTQTCTLGTCTGGVYVATTNTHSTLPPTHMRAELCVQGGTCQPVVVDTATGTHGTFTMSPAPGKTLQPAVDGKHAFLNYAAPSVAYPGDTNNQMYIMPSGPVREGSNAFHTAGDDYHYSGALNPPGHHWPNDPVAVLPWFDMSVAVKNSQENFSKKHWGTTEWNESLVTAAEPYPYLLVTGQLQANTTAQQAIQNVAPTTTYAKKYLPAWLPGTCVGSSSCATQKTQLACTTKPCTWIDYTYMTSPEPSAAPRQKYTSVPAPTVSDDPFMWTLYTQQDQIATGSPLVVKGGKECTIGTSRPFDCEKMCQKGPAFKQTVNSYGPFRFNGIPLCATVDVLESAAGTGMSVRKLPGMFNTPEEGTSACQVGSTAGPELCTDQQLVTYLNGTPAPASENQPDPGIPVWTGNGHHIFKQSGNTWAPTSVGTAVSTSQLAQAVNGGSSARMTLPSQAYCCTYTFASPSP